MGWFGDLLGAVLPIAGGAFLGPAGALGGSVLGGAISGGGSGGVNLAALAPYLSGAATAQRIPGQTQAGEYTPDPGGYGTYNYIPTGATTIDPALISLLQSNLAANTGAAGTAAPLNLAALTNILGANGQMFSTGMGANGALFNQATANPFTDSLMNAAGNAGRMSDQNAVQQQEWGRNLAGAGLGINDMYQNLMSRAASNPFTSSYISGSEDVGQRFRNVGTWLSDYTAGGIQNLQNPFYGQQLTGAQTAGNMLQSAGANAFGQGKTFSGTTAAGLPAALSILNTAFDPQTALYNKTATQTQDQLAAYLARSGLTNSGAGAGIASDALNNFNINWQNNQLARQNAGLAAFANAVPALGNSLGQGANLQTTGAGAYAAGAGLPATTLEQQTGNRFDLSSKGAQALGAAEGLNVVGVGMPYQAYDTTTGDYAKYLAQYANALPAIGGAATGGSNLLDRSALSEYNAGAIPYGAVAMNNQNNATALSNYLGNAGKLNDLSGLPNINQFLTNATAAGNLTNISAAQLDNYLRSVMYGSQIAGNNASGAQNRTDLANAGAAAGINPLITAGLNGLGGFINNTVSPWLSNLFSGSQGKYSPTVYT